MKNVQQVEIVAQRLGSFHCEEQCDPSFPPCLLNFGKRPAKHEARRRLQLRLEERHLVERHAQRLFAQVLVRHIERDAQQTDVTRLKLREEIRRDDVPARAAEEKNERKIEVQIDQPAGMETANSFFDRVHLSLTASRMARAATSFAPPFPSLVMTASKSASIRSRRARSSSSVITSAAIADGCAFP